MRKYTIPQSMSVEYMFGDHLGSANVVTNATGAIVGVQRWYHPYGETRWTTDTIYTDKLFTRWVEPVKTGQREMRLLN